MSAYAGGHEILKDQTRCADIRARLKMCLLKTDCCKIDKHTPRKCLLEHHPSIPNDCYALHNAFFECKRSIIDGRRRFRGPKE